MNSVRVTLFSFAAILSVALAGCANGGNNVVAPTQSPTPTPTVTVPTLTPEEVWDNFNQISDASCQEAYTGLVEEDISGPTVGKLKIQLTFEQAGENSHAYSLPNGEVGELIWSDYLACESKVFIYSMETEGYSYESDPGYSADWPIQITYDPQTDKFTTNRTLPNGDQRTLIFESLAGKFNIVEDVEQSSKTTLTYGLPGPAETQIVNDYFCSLYSSC